MSGYNRARPHGTMGRLGPEGSGTWGESSLCLPVGQTGNAERQGRTWVWRRSEGRRETSRARGCQLDWMVKELDEGGVAVYEPMGLATPCRPPPYVRRPRLQFPSVSRALGVPGGAPANATRTGGAAFLAKESEVRV